MMRLKSNLAYIIVLLLVLSASPIALAQDNDATMSVAQEGETADDGEDSPASNKVYLPFLGTIEMTEFSLPILAIVLGFVDGLNVCSIGALIFILGIVLGLGSRRKIILIGSTFIFTVGLVYFSLVFLWFQFFSALARYTPILNVIVGLIALAGGLYYLREFYIFYIYGPNCKIEKKGIVSNLKKGIRDVLKNPKNGTGMLFAVIAFSTLVTIAEFPCSAAIPAAYTGMLAAQGVSMMQYLAYIGIYAFFYLLIEMIVFFGAVFSSKLWLTSPKFVTWATFVGSMVLIGLGIYYIFIL